MASPREDTCPTCGIAFKAGEKFGPNGIGSGKTCPNGHYNTMAAIRSMRKPWERSDWTCARARVDQHGMHCPEEKCVDCPNRTRGVQEDLIVQCPGCGEGIAEGMPCRRKRGHPRPPNCCITTERAASGVKGPDHG